MLILFFSFIIVKIFFFFTVKNFETEHESFLKFPLVEPTPSEHKSVIINNQTLHYFVSGSKDSSSETLLFLHPAYADHHSFNDQLSAFTDNYKIITVDLPGHGAFPQGSSDLGMESASLFLRKILDKENINNIHLIGVSLGTLIAQDFIYKNPNIVQTFTSVGGYDLTSYTEEINEIKSLQKKEIFKIILRALFSLNAFRAYITETCVITPKAKAQVYQMTQFFNRSSFKAMSKFESLLRPGSREKLNIPLLIISGEKEKYSFSIELSHRWHKNNPGSKLQIMKDAGHCANMDQPASFNKILKEFIESN